MSEPHVRPAAWARCVPCPKCFAPVGERCRAVYRLSNRLILVMTHPERVKAGAALARELNGSDYVAGPGWVTGRKKAVRDALPVLLKERDGSDAAIFEVNSEFF